MQKIMVIQAVNQIIMHSILCGIMPYNICSTALKLIKFLVIFLMPDGSPDEFWTKIWVRPHLVQIKPQIFGVWCLDENMSLMWPPHLYSGVQVP